MLIKATLPCLHRRKFICDWAKSTFCVFFTFYTNQS